MRSVNALLVCSALLVLLPLRARASDLVGPESCRSCHAEAYRIWSTSSHARAADTLGADARNKPLCLQCHSRDEARSGAAYVTGVSCETCHGGGRYYQPEVVMRDKELARTFGLADFSKPETVSATCMACHGGDVPGATAFDLKAALDKIDHWTADRTARAKPRSQLMKPVQNPHQQRTTANSLLARWLKRKS